MNYKQLHKILPLDIIKYIGDYDNTSKERMNSVIQELNEYNHKIEEYWSEQKQELLMSDWEMSCRRRWDPEFANKASPYILKYIHQFLWSL